MSPKLKNIKKEFVSDLPRPRKIDHPLIELITKDIVAESEVLFSTYKSDSDPLRDSLSLEHSFTTPINIH